MAKANESFHLAQREYTVSFSTGVSVSQ